MLLLLRGFALLRDYQPSTPPYVPTSDEQALLKVRLPRGFWSRKIVFKFQNQSKTPPSLRSFSKTFFENGVRRHGRQRPTALGVLSAFFGIVTHADAGHLSSAFLVK